MALTRFWMSGSNSPIFPKLRLVAAAFIPALFTFAVSPAQADVTISSDETANMNCTNGVCAPTASDAVLNVTDLKGFLASGNLTVTTTGSGGVQANNIAVTAKFGWSGAKTLALDAYQSISVGAAVTVKGKSGLSFVTNDGGSVGALSFGNKGRVSFNKLQSHLTINGAAYMLAGNVSDMASLINGAPNGNYALATNYDASQDGTYKHSPILTAFTGVFNGLGNSISNLTIDVPLTTQDDIGLFAAIGQNGMVSDLKMTGVSATVGSVKGKGRHVDIGALAGSNIGAVVRCEVSGVVNGGKYTFAGGLAGISSGNATDSHARVTVKTGTYISEAGGLVGENYGQIARSYSAGDVKAYGRESVYGGGLVAYNAGTITNSYATGDVSGTDAAGGLVGGNTGQVTASYSTGTVTGPRYLGGLIGFDDSTPGSLTATYWDTDTSGITNPAQGAGNIANDPGITGLTTEQLQSGLPAGFDPSIWGEDPGINDGLPYLLAIPPAN